LQNKTKSKNVGIVVQARVGSQRLPSKVLMQIEGKPLLGRVVERLKRVSDEHILICAIPDNDENAVLEVLCKKLGIHVVRGPEEDVLARYITAAEQFNLSDVIRITADCPLIDFRIIDAIREIHFKGGWDFTANLVGTVKAFPRGMDVEIVKTSALRSIAGLAHEQKFREHVTLYAYENPANFRMNIIAPSTRQARPDLRLCVDEPADLELVRKIYRHFLPETDFSLDDIITFLDVNPEVANLNKDVKQKTC
jgi:spore coat polysaccharide biosynthesis protein SpsF